MNQEWKDVADVLRTRGWNQGDWVGAYDEANGSVCLLGACGVAWHGDPRHFERTVSTDGTDDFRVALLAGAVHDTGFDDMRLGAMELVIAFNDYPERVLREVLDLVDGLANRVLNDCA